MADAVCIAALLAISYVNIGILFTNVNKKFTNVNKVNLKFLFFVRNAPFSHFFNPTRFAINACFTVLYIKSGPARNHEKSCFSGNSGEISENMI